MKRRIILLTVTFLCLLMVFGLYKLAWSSAGAARPRQQLAKPTVNIAPVTKPGMRIGPGDELYWESRDKNNWLDGIYTAKQWQGLKDGSYQLTEPLITLFLKNNQQVAISADEGNVYMEEVGKNRRIRRGTLSGNVKIVMDMSTAMPRSDLSNRPDDMVTISLEDVTLRDDLLRMSTDGSVKVVSAQADMAGRGLNITWNEQPRELRELRLEQGREIVMKNIPESLAGMGKSAKRSGSTDAASTATAPTGDEESVVPPVELAELKPSASQPASQPVSKPTSKSSGKSASRPTTTAPAANQYCAVLTDKAQNLSVVSGGRKLLNVGTLTLSFDVAKKSGQARQPATTQPASAKAAKTKPQDKEPTTTMTVTWSGPLVLTPVGYTATPVKDRIDVVAKGDNLLVSDSQSLASSGTITCGLVEFHSLQQASYVRGRPGQLAVLETADGNMIEAQTFIVDNDNGSSGTKRIRMEGPGKMTRASGGGIGEFTSASAKPALPSQPATSTQPATPDVITWQQGVLAHFVSSGTNKTYLTDATFNGKVEFISSGTAGNYVKCDNLNTTFTQTDEGKSVIHCVTASGNVTAKLDSTNVAGGDSLAVAFKTAPTVKDGKPTFTARPDTIDAIGKPVVITDTADPNTPVKAQGGNIHCVSKAPADADIAEPAGKRPLRKTEMAVTLKGLDDAPAEVHFGPNSIVGPTIYLDKIADVASVTGPGNLAFLSSQDMQGNKLDKPELLSMEWAESMDYKGNGGELNGQPVGPYAQFVGDVAMRMGGEFLSGGQMTAYFQPRPIEAAAAMPAIAPARPAKSASKPTASGPAGPADSRIALGLDSFSKLKILKVDARDNVMLVSERSDAAGKVVQSMKIMARKSIVYDFTAKLADIDSTGSFLMEDYRPNDPADASAKNSSSAKTDVSLDMMGQKMERPNQLAGTWSKSMQWSQAPTGDPKIKGENIMTMNGNARIEYRSGKEIVVEKPIASLKTGRKGHVYGDRIEVHFAPEDKPASPPAPAANSGTAVASKPANIFDKGMGVGQLSMFIVTGAEFGEPRIVDLQDGGMQVFGRQVTFDRKANLLEVWGSLRTEKQALASVTTVNPSNGKSNPPTQSPYIKCTLRDGKLFSVEAKNISGGAAR
jgi:hypothetical protein